LLLLQLQQVGCAQVIPDLIHNAVVLGFFFLALVLKLLGRAAMLHSMRLHEGWRCCQGRHCVV
jgi:hypothetical protein